MIKLLATIAALLLACSAFAQGTGLKPSKGAGQAPATKSDPAPATKPDPASATSSVQVQVPATGPGESNAGIESLEKIFACLAVGLPKDWRSATIEVIEVASSGGERQFEAKYTYTRTLESKTVPLEPCDTTGPARGVHGLNDFLEPEKRQWKRAILTFNSNGKFELKYDYTE
jgi:hypothetical protein